MERYVIFVTTEEVEMGLSPQLITESLYVEAVRELSNLREDNRVGMRLRGIVSAKEHGVNVVSKVFNITTNTLRAWVKGYRDNGLSGLYYKPGRGRKSKLQENHCDAIKQWLEEEPNLTLSKLVVRLKEVFDLDTSSAGVYRTLLKMKLSYYNASSCTLQAR
ncbi:helix-turn-helix domain-containing protein [Rickettsiales endosymbiont of Peranema trichophorum]|uniref:helix-turn-helix domain-containing protein n=1 Tax=Rickettsiales endosymbiont of Peranema trichophorum TaxID=2486577 RepID=UPI001022C569|nr:helix-turn-helix domain-containing protein [Rickettsiales endosymbiont of Peranema trichophorum]RZI46795.1 helix-turn-helix domain-containing protein [Rickettsiales endosymbiont of Peranema trichophorum]